LTNRLAFGYDLNVW
jgi:hypothetical protein